jgi:hypothetical protein
MKLDDDIARPWRPQSLRSVEDDATLLLRAVSLGLAITVVAGAMLWLSREDGPPPAGPIERQARARPAEPSASQRRAEFPSSQPDDAPSRESPLPAAFSVPVARTAQDLPSVIAPTAAPGQPDSRTRAQRLMSLPALPSPVAPLAQTRPVLQPRAAAGDGVAACRLAFARARCEGEARAGPIAPGSFCAGSERDPLPRTEDLLHPAEPWLTPRQKVLLALIRPDGGVARLARPGAAAPEGYVYPQYLADHAYDFLLEGFRSRDPLALEGLAIVHAPGDPARWNRNGPVLPNPKLFLFYTGILQRLNGESAIGQLARDTVAATRATLDPRDVAEADAKADAEVRLWLAARPMAAWQAEWQELLHGDLRLQDCAR